MKNILKSSIIMLFAFAFVTGILYPMLITGISQIFLPWQANGSVVKNAKGEIIGSQNIGQSFQGPEYFWGRPSATADFPYNAKASGGSNLSVLNKDLQSQVKDRITQYEAADPANTLPIPIDLITTSASGLDPDISPEAALYQVHRVAQTRGLPEEKVKELVMSHIEQPTVQIFGEPRVNVLLLNIALDSVQYTK
ncbi:MAG TPA: potassium-transporting ATPase subunit KdpC [Leptolinea sp.]